MISITEIKTSEIKNQLTESLSCPCCGRDYSGDCDDDDIFVGASCPENDCSGYDV